MCVSFGVRAAIGVGEGDKPLFVRMDDGSITLRSTNLEALREGQRAFAGAAAEAGLHSDEDVVGLVKHIRAKRAAPHDEAQR